MSDQGEGRYYKIGEISKICNIPIRTLHHYDDFGLLKPAKVDAANNYRYYTHEQLHDISTIKYFKTAGFSLAEIKKLIERDDLDYSQQMIQCKCDEIEREIIQLSSLKNKLHLYLDKMGGNDENASRPFAIHVRDIPLSFVAYCRYTAPCKREEFILRFTKLTNLIEKNSLQITGTMRAIFYDDYREFDYDQADIEVCVPVHAQREEDQVVRRYGGFLGAVAYHYGSYQTMSETYKQMLDWLDKNNMVFVGGAIENYIIDGITTSCEDEYVTEVILPVKKVQLIHV